MLENKEALQGIDLPQVFSRMLEEIPWTSLRAYVQSNSQLLKLCTIGGHRLEPKRRKRIHSVLLKEAKKAEFSQAFCNPLFAVWYPVHEDLHKSLEEYFHSDEYKAYREEKELSEDSYVLPDDVFDSNFKVEQLEQWRILLCYSPLQLTDEQTSKILDDNQGNVELLRRLREAEERLQEAEKERSRLATESKRLKKEFQQSNKDAAAQKKTNRELRAEVSALENRADAAQTENKRLSEELREAERKIAGGLSEAKAAMQADMLRLENDLKRAQEQLIEWQAKYEQQRLECRDFEEKLDNTRQDLRKERHILEQAQDEIDFLSSFPNLLLSKFDWPKVGTQMKLTPTLRRQFNSLIRRLNYEKDMTLSLEGSLSEFWGGLMRKEEELIQAVSESNTREVMSGGVEEYWLNMTDAFEDVRISLEARCILLKMLHEIFYQVLEMDDLEEPIVPKKSARSKGLTSV